MAGGEHDQAAGDERDHGGQDGNHDAAGAAPERGQRRRRPGGGTLGLAGLGLELVVEQAHDATWAGWAEPPVIAAPSRSSVTSAPNSPTIVPS